eukprot:1866708-Amphidinium_carterae.1
MFFEILGLGTGGGRSSVFKDMLLFKKRLSSERKRAQCPRDQKLYPHPRLQSSKTTQTEMRYKVQHNAQFAFLGASSGVCISAYVASGL